MANADQFGASTLRWQDRIATLDDLDQHYGQAKARSLTKELDHLSPQYQAFVEKAPFVAIATSGPGGLDCSPRGDPPGFIRVVNQHTLLMPDRRGNNRLDTLRNLIINPRISLLFLIPGVGETLRINGTAALYADPQLCASFEINGKSPASVIAITVERVYFQCQKALIRSRLWDLDAQIARSQLPSPGDILSAIDTDIDGTAFDEAYPEETKNTIY